MVAAGIVSTEEKIHQHRKMKWKSQRGFAEWSQHCASHSREKPFEVSVFSGSPMLHCLEWESVQVFVSVPAQGRMWDGGRFTMATTNAAMGEETESGRGCHNNGGFEEGRWNVILNRCSEWARSAFWCLVWSTPNGTSICGWNEAGPALAVQHCTTVSQRGDDAGALYSCTLPILSRGSFTLFPISAYTGQSP